MLKDILQADHIYIACGATDMRKGIDGLAAVVQLQFELDPFASSAFLFCGRRKDRIKALIWEDDGFLLAYKRLENGHYQWPQNEDEMRQITKKELDSLLEGFSIVQKKTIHKATPGHFC